MEGRSYLIVLSYNSYSTCYYMYDSRSFFCFAFLLFSRRNETIPIPIQSRIESLLIHNLNNYCSMWAVTFGAIQLLLLLALKNCMNLIVMPRLFKELGTSAASEGLSQHVWMFALMCVFIL
jgi:hypothetical protein